VSTTRGNLRKGLSSATRAWHMSEAGSWATQSRNTQGKRYNGAACKPHQSHNSELWLSTMTIHTVLGRIGTRLFDERLAPRGSIMLGLAIVTLAWAAVINLASIADGTLQLPGHGRGLLNHYGFQASFVAAPLVLLTVYYALSYFMQLLQTMDDLLVQEADLAAVRAMVKPHVDSLFLRGKWRSILGLFIFIGVAASVAMFGKLDNPSAVWGNDVFNATYYPYGFFAANIFFLWLWGFVYPLGFFYALHLTLSSEIIVARLKRRDYLRLDFLHIDRCDGMSRFGTLNFLVMLIYLWPAGAVYAFHITHRDTYSSLIVGAVAVSAAFIVQSVYGVYWVSRAISSERKAAVEVLNAKIRNAMGGTPQNFAAAAATLQYRDRVLTVASFPYSERISAALNVLRFAPSLIPIAKAVAGSG
jgi:hypothetical protein